MADCACSGIRSCLLCEGKKDVKDWTELKPNHETNLKTLIFCIKCQKLCSQTGFQEDFLQNSAQNCSKHDCFEDLVSGITVIEDFITKDEEKFMVEEIEKFPWQVSQSGRQKQVGQHGQYIFPTPLVHRA